MNHQIKDKKRDYLIRTLSRTKRKDYENYIINAIYHKLNRLDIHPVTQQYIKRSDGKYALVDLYFPQIHYGIECDEAYHLGNHEQDKIRKLTMEEMLDSVDETRGFILRRVRAYESLDSINQQINDIVNEILLIIEERQIKPWEMEFDSVSYSINQGKITVKDRLEFSKIVDIAKCFGKNYKGYQMSGIKIGFGYSVWCPKLAIMVDGKAEAAANGWINTLSSDWMYIYEEHEEKESILYASGDAEQKRIIFAKSKNNLGYSYYRFIGVYQYRADQSTSTKNIYERIATEIDLRRWVE